MRERLYKIIIVFMLILSTISLSALAFPPEIELPPTINFVTMRVEDGENSWFKMMISDVSMGYDITNGTYLGWCAQNNILMTRGVNHAVRLYSSYDPDMPESFKSDYWPEINYILNNKQGDKESIQDVIWYYLCYDSYPSNPIAQEMIAGANQSGSNFIPDVGEIVVILVQGVDSIQRSFFEYNITVSNSDDSSSGSYSNATGNNVQNHAPTADGTAGEPYTGFAHGQITFDGSRSYDIDGRIVTYIWDFGDGNFGSGSIVNHSYDFTGNFMVVLTVKDDKRAIDTYNTTALITLGNNPPTTPTLSGPQIGNKNRTYEFTMLSTDPDNDSLAYIIDWGDGENMTIDNSSSGVSISQTHIWSEAGRYTIKVKTSDGSIESIPIFHVILIDVLDVGDVGYLVEKNNDETYDSFFSYSVGAETTIEKSDNGNYLIDTDGDGIYDYEYNSDNSQLDVYLEQPIGLYIGIAILLIACGILFFVLEVKKKKSKS